YSCIYLFIKCDRHNLNLYSFPTRRSSDLGTYKTYNHKGDIFKGRDARLMGTVILPGSKFKGKSLDILAGYYLPKKPKGQRIITGDRKSTRLNSSHVSISYAVFCLKKKKKQ